MSDEDLKILFGEEISADDIFAKLKKIDEDWVRRIEHEKSNRKRSLLSQIPQKCSKQKISKKGMLIIT